MMKLPQRLEYLAEQAEGIGYDMKKYPDPLYIQHGCELLGAAGLMREWASAIKHNNAPERPEA